MWWWVITLIIVLIIIFYLCRNTFVKSRFDGRDYYVANFPRKQDAADILARIAERLQKIIIEADRAAPANTQFRAEIDKIKEAYHPEMLCENHPWNILNKDTSYVFFKRKMYLCLRSRSPLRYGHFHDSNTLMFVAIHELSHLGIDDIEHPPEFWALFRKLLAIAADNNLYIPVKYHLKPVEYCGMKITSTPLR